MIKPSICETNIINLLMKYDQDICNTKKDIPIKNGVIDFRYMLLSPKIETLIGRHKSVKKDVNFHD